VKFLVDANFSPIIAALLNEAGHDAVAVRDLGLQDASDETILERALTTTQVAALIIDNLDVMFEDLTAGAIITFARGHLRSRRLPLR